MVNIGLLRAQIKSGLRNVRCLVVVALSLFYRRLSMVVDKAFGIQNT